MPNNTLIQQFKSGKFKVDIDKLDNFDKIKIVRIENLLKDLAEYYERTKKLMVQFDEGRFKDEFEKVSQTE